MTSRLGPEAYISCTVGEDLKALSSSVFLPVDEIS